MSGGRNNTSQAAGSPQQPGGRGKQSQQQQRRQRPARGAVADSGAGRGAGCGDGPACALRYPDQLHPVSCGRAGPGKVGLGCVVVDKVGCGGSWAGLHARWQAPGSPSPAPSPSLRFHCHTACVSLSSSSRPKPKLCSLKADQAGWEVGQNRPSCSVMTGSSRSMGWKGGTCSTESGAGVVVGWRVAEYWCV